MTVPADKNKILKIYRKLLSNWDTDIIMLFGGVLLLTSVFVSQRIFDAIYVGVINALDFRLWPWWYFIVLILVVVFSIKWFWIIKALREDELDEVDLLSVKRFMIMSITITVECAFVVSLHATSLLIYVYRPILLWFRFGVYSHRACLTLVLFVILFSVTVYVVKEWLAVILRPE